MWSPGTAAGAVVVLVAALSGATNPVPAGSSQAEQELLTAQRSFINANNTADLATLDRLTADEWIGVRASGVVRTKAEFLAEVGKRGPAKVQATPEQLMERRREWKVRVYDTVGVVTRLTAGDHGSRSWISAVWVRRDGRWQRVLSHETTAAKE
jgi:hypothetical protein